MLDVLNIIAMGQCGCRIAKEFNARGFSACYINSDTIDMRDLDVPRRKILMLDTTGSGRSPRKGRSILERNFEKFAAFMDNNLDDTKLNVFVIGLGGGTGGGMIVPAMDYAKEQGYRVGVIATLPPKLAGMLDMENALKCLKELKERKREKNIDMFVLCDNQFLMEKVGIGSDWWQKINYHIVSRIIACFDILREGKTSQTGIGSIDKGELKRILQFGQGLLDVRDVYFSIPDEIHLSDEEIKKKLFEPSLIAGYNYKKTLFYMISIDVPLNTGYTDFASRVFDISKNSYGSSLGRIGMFNDPEIQQAIRVTMISAGLQTPKVLTSKINNLKRDAQRFEDKKNKEDVLDFSPMEDVQIDDDFDL